MPVIRKLVIKNDPPAEMKGKGKPLTGINPTVIAVLIKTCEIKIVAIPINARLEKRSFDKNANLTICIIKYPIVISTNATVIKPNSSPITDKIKSDSWTGKTLDVSVFLHPNLCQISHQIR